MSSKKCFFCAKDIKYIDYKNEEFIRSFITYFSKIKPRYYTGICLRHQKIYAKAVKRARHMALVPFIR